MLRVHKNVQTNLKTNTHKTSIKIKEIVFHMNVIFLTLYLSMCIYKCFIYYYTHLAINNKTEHNCNCMIKAKAFDNLESIATSSFIHSEK